MIRSALVGLVSALSVVVAIVACSATTTSAVVQDITPAGACIATQLLDGGASDPLQIIAACAGVTIEDVIQVVETLMASQPDAAASPTAMRLAAVHVRAIGLKGVTIHGGK